MSLEGPEKKVLFQAIERLTNVEQLVTAESYLNLNVVLKAMHTDNWYIKQVFKEDKETAMILWERRCLKSL